MAGAEAAAPEGSVNSSLSGLVKDGPVMGMLNKRLRALKKKYNRILQIEESRNQGKAINKEQEDVLKAKVSVALLIEEYEKLRQPLSLAVKEELGEREKEPLSSEDNENENGSKVAAEEEDKEGGVDEKRTRTLDSQESREVEVREAKEASCRDVRDGAAEDAIAEVLKILYLGRLFNVVEQNDSPSIMWSKMHERSSCLSYDFVTDDTNKPLREEDLDHLSLLGSLMISRPQNATLSHKTALENCLYHAQQWQLNSEQTIHPDVSVSYSDLREKLNRIISSEYFTMIPEFQTISQQTAAAAATTAGQYVTQALAQDSSAEGNIYHTEAPTVYYKPEDQSHEEQKFYHTEEYNGTPDGTEDPLDSVGEVNPSALYVPQNDTSLEDTQSYANQNASLDPALEQRESHMEPLMSQSQVPQQKQHSPVQQGHQELELDPKVHEQQQEYKHKESQQHAQYHSQNGGSSRGYQGQRGGRGMGYGGGRGRGYTNGRGRFGRGGGYSNGRGQYYEQGNYYRRNFNSGRGRGRRNTEMMDNNYVDGALQDNAATQAN
ncbi:hypothetical protein SUGI_0946950 [Cryptomeria japonica]|uniref:uncharacterized protein LOC131066924 n=1 Tax=Cryptomeria japonica TaxID=3369 RepID=UPI0024146958|nr:uncharacterized protein LOC131066924 [Cryptomeria japonica]GLJ44986.1 hypothetical protein SUGI_0946950 [Cryptomeria japonica]